MANFFQRQKSGALFQKGFFSIEMIVVLAVALGILAWGASKMDILTSSSDATEELSNLQALYASTKGLKTNSGYGTSGTNLVPSLIASNSVPKNISVVSGVMYNLYGGAITVVSNGNTFTITQNAITPAGCTKLAPQGSKSGVFATTRINSNTAITGEVTSAVAGTQCSGATNNVAFTTAS